MRAARGVGSLLLLVTACGGGGGGGTLITPPGGPPPFTSVTQVRVSQASTFTAGCDGVPATGTLYLGVNDDNVSDNSGQFQVVMSR